MIEELTILSFSKYGMPVYFNKSHFTADFTAKKYQLQPGVEQRLFRYAGDVYLEPLRGVGVLYVQSETGAVKEFLLDKKTKVNGGRVDVRCRLRLRIYLYRLRSLHTGVPGGGRGALRPASFSRATGG